MTARTEKLFAMSTRLLPFLKLSLAQEIVEDDNVAALVSGCWARSILSIACTMHSNSAGRKERNVAFFCKNAYID